MNRSRLSLYAAGSLIALGMANSVLAADLPYQQPQQQYQQPYQAPVNRVQSAWSGFYAGAQLGYSWTSYSALLTPGPSAFDIDTGSVSGGVFAGMNFQIAPQFIAGFEGDFAFMRAKGSQLITGNVYQASTDWQGTLRGRLGYTVDNLMFYGTAGLALADIQYTAPFGQADTTKLGWALGFGAEAKLTDNIFARAEYLYANYGKEPFSLGGSTIRSDLDTHTVRVGVGYRF